MLWVRNINIPPIAGGGISLFNPGPQVSAPARPAGVSGSAGMAAVARGRPARAATGPVQDPAIPPRMTEIDTTPEFCHQSTAAPVTPQNPISKIRLYQPVKKSPPRHTRSTPIGTRRCYRGSMNNRTREGVSWSATTACRQCPPQT